MIQALQLSLSDVIDISDLSGAYIILDRDRDVLSFPLCAMQMPDEDNSMMYVGITSVRTSSTPPRTPFPMQTNLCPSNLVPDLPRLPALECDVIFLLPVSLLFYPFALL